MKPLAPFTRVVTGHAPAGKAVITSHGPTLEQFAIAAIPGMLFQEVWHTQGLPVILDNGADPTASKPLRLAPD
jgi:hypothetical protein